MKAAESLTLVGQALEGRYAIVREIGRGGMGVVYEAEHTELGKRVAVKVLLDKYANDDEAIVRFKREALAASRIGSPHIIDVSHIGALSDHRPFVVMELLEGESLAALLRRTGPMQEWRALHIMRQVLRATSAAHSKGIIHRDLKPDNIFIVNRDDQQDFVKLLDFGISKFLETGEHSLQTQLTTTGVVMGTPLYMAPEQAMGQIVTPSVDIYACGVILYEMLAGRPPFNDGNYNMIVAKLLTAPPPPLGELRKGLPKPLIAIVHRALDKEPAARFPTTEAFLAALPGDRQSSPEIDLRGTLMPGATLGTPLVRTTVQRKPARWLVGGAAILVGAAIGATLIATHVGNTPAAATVTTPVPTTTPTTEPQPQLPPVPKSTGILELKTIPPNATIQLDRADAGTTPIEIAVAPGRHRIHIELRGYIGVDADQDVNAGERTSATFTLVPRSTAVVQPPQQPPVTTPPVVHHQPPATTPNTTPAGSSPQNPYPDDGSSPPALPVKKPKLPPAGSKPNPYDEPGAQLR